MSSKIRQDKKRKPQYLLGFPHTLASARRDCVPADGGHGWQSQRSCLWKQTAAHKTPGQGQRTGRAVSLWEW